MVFVIKYFAARGRAEISRLICEEAGIPYKNEFVQFDQMAALKSSLPFGQLPVLYDDSNKSFELAQSVAIARFLARKANLIPSNLEDAGLVDMYVDGVSDLKTAGYSAFFAKEDKEQKLKTFAETTVPSFLDKYEGFLKKAGGEYFVGGKFTFADIVVFEALEAFDKFVNPIVDKYPTLKAFRASVAARPNLAKYIASDSRPKAFGG